MNGHSIPMIKNTNTGVIIRHQESLTDIGPSNKFIQRTYSINPGLATTFPWLSMIAANYEQWKPRGILFMYKAMSANALTGTNTSLGTVVLATEYNAADTLPYETKSDMENQEFSNSAKPSKSIIHPIECSKYQNPMSILYTRPGQTPPNADVRLYDLGIFTIGTQGMQLQSTGAEPIGTIGELWISYEIEFFKPKQSNLTIALEESWEVTSPNPSSTAMSQLNPFGNVFALPGSGSNLAKVCRAQSNAAVIIGYNVLAGGTRINLSPDLRPGDTFEFVFAVSGGGDINCGAGNSLVFPALGAANPNMLWCQPMPVSPYPNDDTNIIDGLTTFPTINANISNLAWKIRINILPHNRNETPSFVMAWQGPLTAAGNPANYVWSININRMDSSYVTNCLIAQAPIV
jgi:hypothetical protein